MLEYADFYDIAEYGNENWKGSFTQKGIANNLGKNLKILCLYFSKVVL